MPEQRYLTVNVPATLEQVAIAATGNVGTVGDFQKLNHCAFTEATWIDGSKQRTYCSAPFKPGQRLVIPRCCQPIAWTDVNRKDPHERKQIAYWTARILEALLGVHGSAIGVTSTRPCGFGDRGGPGDCCDPTSDPFPSKPYLYVLPPGKTPYQVAADFGRNEFGWIELRRANADDPRGFNKMANGYCWWNDWSPGKRLRIPGSWSESQFTAAVKPHLFDGWGRKIDPTDVIAGAAAIFKALPQRWETPVNMQLDVGVTLYRDAAFVRQQVYDEDVAKLVAEELFRR